MRCAQRRIPEDGVAGKVVVITGAIDVMVNNAGTMPLGFYADHATAADACDRCIDINIKGVLHSIQAVHDQMIAQGRGHLTNLSSIYGNFPVVGAAVYGATKVAVDFLSESLRMESRGKIQVTIVKPTGVPGTNLGSGIINMAALAGIYGTEYFAFVPEYIADAILHAIDQPWGVSIGEITVAASGDGYVL